MRKHCKRVARRALVPTMVAMAVAPECEMSEHMALKALAEGWATTSQFNCLLDCADLLLLAAADRKDAGAGEVAHLARTALANIADRFKEVKKLGATGEELKALRVLVDASGDFWNRKSGGLFADAYKALGKYRATQAEAVPA